MSERARGLGRGLGALIPSESRIAPDPDRPVDVLFAEGPRFTGNHTQRTAMPDVFGRPDTEPTPPTDRPGAFPSVGTDLAFATEHAPDEADTGMRVVTEPPSAGPPDGSPHDGLAVVAGAAFAQLPVESIRPNPRQPRVVFDEDSLRELSQSVAIVGVLQPIVVRPAEHGYELVMGERRLRAAQAAGLDIIPAIVRQTGEDSLLRDALLENLHRADLNSLEEAAAYQQLLDDFGCTHDELATRLGRSRPQISNTLRLLKLPPLVQRRVAAGVLSAGHARALLGLPDPSSMERLAQRVVAEGLSVRATEEAVAVAPATGDEGDPRRPASTSRPGTEAHAEWLQTIASALSEQLETTVKVTMSRKRGRVTVDFADLEDLERILAALR